MSAQGTGGAPRVTVLMPVHDGKDFLPEAIESILCQTLRDFELLVVDDGSRDGSDRIAESYRDPRIRLVRNERHLGLIETLNRGLDLARGEIVARMDADDVSLPERLARQVAFLDASPGIGACGSWVTLTGDAESRVHRYPTRPDDVRCQLLFEPALAHPTVCLRRAWFDRHGLRFEPGYAHAEDYRLWRRASAIFPICNLGEPLLRYRVHAGSVSRRRAREQQATVERIHREALRELGLEPTQAELRLHRGDAANGAGIAPLAEIERWLLALRRANEARGCHPGAAFERTLADRWIRAALRAVAHGQPAVARFLRSPLSRRVAPRRRLRLLAHAASRALGGDRGARRSA